MSRPAAPASDDPDPLVLVGALHVDELCWPTGRLVPRASNPVRHARRPGGVAANVARAAAASGDGRAVVLCAALGDDADARWLLDALGGDGVDCRAVRVPGRPTGRYTVVHDEAGELLLGLSDVDIAETLDAAAVRAALAGTRAAALVLDANLSPGCLAALLERADAADPGPRAPRVALAVSPAKAARLAPHLGALDLLFCNRREGAALAGTPADAPLEAIADALLALGCRRFVLSDGGAPIVVQRPEGRHLVPVPRATIRGTVNGAGDALAGATLARWLARGDLTGAVSEAGVAAAGAVLAAAGP